MITLKTREDALKYIGMPVKVKVDSSISFEGILYECPNTTRIYVFSNNKYGNGAIPDNFEEVNKGFKYSWRITNILDSNIITYQVDVIDTIGKL